MVPFAKEINTVLVGLNEQNVSDTHLLNDSKDIPKLDGYTNDLLFVNLKCGRSIVYRYNTIRKQFDLWQGASFMMQEK